MPPRTPSDRADSAVRAERQLPWPLRAACVLVVLQGAVLAGFGVLEVVHTSSGNTGVAITTAVFFVVVGVALAFFARSLAQGRSWARGPVVAAQLIELLTAYSFLGGDTDLVALVLAVVGVAVLAGIFHPASVQALAADDRA